VNEAGKFPQENRGPATRKTVPAESPEAYIASLTGWQQRYAQALRSAVASTSPLRETLSRFFADLRKA